MIEEIGSVSSPVVIETPLRQTVRDEKTETRNDEDDHVPDETSDNILDIYV